MSNVNLKNTEDRPFAKAIDGNLNSLIEYFSSAFGVILSIIDIPEEMKEEIKIKELNFIKGFRICFKEKSILVKRLEHRIIIRYIGIEELSNNYYEIYSNDENWCIKKFENRIFLNFDEDLKHMHLDNIFREYKSNIK
ncbi:hypothetical protein ACMGD3_08780 [Lysinibacillus sphaericus]|uniref:hypothetical protein n=1 Tax=Lysinibacillus sphaericus TaxID=1421 RepID=UPI001C5EC565